MIISANQVSIDFRDTDYAKESGVPVQDAREGMVSQLGIEYTRDCAVHKDMENSIVYTDAAHTRENVVEEVAKNVKGCEFDPADFISQSMNGKDAKSAEEDGTILEEYVAGTLDRVIEQIKSQRQEQEKAVTRQVESAEEEREFFEDLERRVVEAAQMASGVQGFSDVIEKHFLENRLPFTPESINRCSTVPSTNAYTADRASYEEMRPQLEAAIENGGLELSEENREAARWLYENDVPVTRETIQDFEMLRELEETSPEVLYERIADEVIDGRKPEFADLTVPSRGEAADRLRKLVATDDDTLRRAIRTEAGFITAKRQLEEIRLTMTIDAARLMESKGIHLDIENLVSIVDELKVMEREAAEAFLIEADLPVDNDNIDIMARTLRAGNDILRAPVAVYGTTIATADRDTIEDVAAAGNAYRSEMGSRAGAFGAQGGRGTTEIGELSGVPNGSTGDALHSGRSADAAGSRWEPWLEAAQSYEAVGTEVRRDLGDSMAKAFSNVDDILEDLALPATAANERAVRILAYNQMPLTRESILSMKEYDDKVTTLANGLRPAVVSELIRRQENPLEMSLDELSGKVTQINKEIVADDIPFRKYIWKLDHSGDITAEERKSLIGVYRLLDKVEKSDGAVIGQVVKEGRELSLSSLLSAVRSRKAKGMDQTVDDDFGGLEQIVTKAESISDQIGAAFGENVVSKLKRDISPTVLRAKQETFFAEPLEILMDECSTGDEAAQEEAAYYDERAAEIRRMAAEGDTQLIRYLKELDMPDSIVNIHLMKNFLEQGGRAYLKRYTREESEQIIDAFDDPEELPEVYEEIDRAHEERLKEEKKQPDIHFDTIRDIARMASSISFYRQMRRFRKYEVPIVTENGVTSCNVTVKQGSGEQKGTVEIALDSVRNGSVQATFKVSGSRVCGFVTSDDDQALRVSEEIMSGFEKDLEMNGFTMERGDFAKGRRNSFHLGDREDETVTNNTLYRVAKLFIQNVQRKEEQK